MSTVLGPVVVAVPDRDVFPSLRYASREALLHDTGLLLVHVLRPGEDRAAAEALVSEAVDVAGALAGPGIAVTGRVVSGPPVSATLDAAPDAALVVLRHRDVVHLMRTFADREPDGPLPAVACVPADWRLVPDDTRPVLAGVADPDRCDAVVGQALDLAHAHSARLELLHAWHFPSPYDEEIVARVGEHWRRETRALIDDVVAHCRTEHDGTVPVDVRVEHGSAAPLLVEAGRHAQALVLEQNPPRPGIGTRLGRTARTAIHECPCPVLLLPPGHRRVERGRELAGAGASGAGR